MESAPPEPAAGRLREGPATPSRRLPIARLVVAALAVAVAVLTWRAYRSEPASPTAADGNASIWVVDAGFATQYPTAVGAISDAGGEVRVYDFPGADLPNGNRYVWARDYGPLEMPLAAGAPPTLWDARNGGSATPELETKALERLAALLGVRHRALDLVVQGGNWLPLPDGRVIVSTRLFEDNRALGSPAEIAERLQPIGVGGLIAIDPLPGELTRHADMVLAVEPGSGRVFVGDLWPEAIARIPPESGWDMYRDMASAARASLDRTALELGAKLGEDRVFRFPQPLPYLDRHPTRDLYRPSFPSFVNGIFVTAPDGQRTYLYGLSRGSDGADYYSFDRDLVEDYVAAVAAVGRSLGFSAKGVETGALVRNGGSLHCATVQCPLARRAPSRAP